VRAPLSTLDAVADTIVPRDSDPGALDADVPRRIRQALEADREAQALYRDGLALVETLARRAGATSFAALDAPAREALLRTVATRGNDLGRRFFDRVRDDVLRYYWASAPGQRVVGYEPPGGGYPIARSQPRPPGQP
jgi:hypothetical protein